MLAALLVVFALFHLALHAAFAFSESVSSRARMPDQATRRYLRIHLLFVFDLQIHVCSTCGVPDTKTNTVSFTVKGQVVIPRSIRREFEIEDGTRAIIQTTADGILLKPITGKYIRSLRGKYKHLDLMKGLAESRKEDRQRDR